MRAETSNVCLRGELLSPAQLPVWVWPRIGHLDSPGLLASRDLHRDDAVVLHSLEDVLEQPPVLSPATVMSATGQRCCGSAVVGEPGDERQNFDGREIWWAVARQRPDDSRKIQAVNGPEVVVDSLAVFV